VAARQRSADQKDLLIRSGFALVAMTIVAIGLGWLIAGRVLAPLRTITEAARRISASSLHERLALAGPDDELKALGDTFDALLTRLERAFTSQRQFVANASHELRTPLTLERALLEAALTDPDPTPQSWRTACERALAANMQQEHLIEALLTLARGEGGLDRLEPVDLTTLTDGVVGARHADADRANIGLTTTLDPADVCGDPRLLERLIANLIDNAVRHNTAGGRVEVRTGAVSGRPTLSVGNSGPSVPPGELERLFQPFQRMSEARHHDGGLGLGLSIVRAVATAHGAHVSAEPRSGGGLDVTVSFPIAASVLSE
jgi:signal transduction histidine kinase